MIDGTGAPERHADVAFLDGRVVSIDEPERVDADTVIDASGKVVAPGFVDIHSHGDVVLAWPSDDRLSLIEGRIGQGITTEILGNCGLGASPLFGHGAELLPQINGWMTPASFDWSWRDLAGYFDHLEALGLPSTWGLSFRTARCGSAPPISHRARPTTPRDGR